MKGNTYLSMVGPPEEGEVSRKVAAQVRFVRVVTAFEELCLKK